MVAFIDEHKACYGVEPMCSVLPIAPSTYYEHNAAQRDPDRRSERAKRDEVLGSEVERVWRENRSVYGARKVWRQLRRESFDVARCTVERLMRNQGLRGVVRGRRVRTVCVGKHKTTRVFWVSIHTSKDNVIAGGSGCKQPVAFRARPGQLVAGFVGRSGDEIDKLGVVFAPLPDTTPRCPPWRRRP